MNEVTTEEIFGKILDNQKLKCRIQTNQMQMIFKKLLQGRIRPVELKPLLNEMPEKTIFRRLHQMEKLGIIEKIIEDGHVFYGLPK